MTTAQPVKIREAAKRLGKDERTIRRMVKDGELDGTTTEDGAQAVTAASLSAALENAIGGSPLIEAAGLGALAGGTAAEVVEASAALLRQSIEAQRLAQEPLRLFLESLSGLLARSMEREARLYEALAKGQETIQKAQDRTLERELTVDQARSRDRLMGNAFEWLKTEAPKALGYSKVADALPKLAPMLAGTFTPEVQAELSKDLDAESAAALAVVLDMVRTEVAKAAAAPPPPPAEAPAAEAAS